MLLIVAYSRAARQALRNSCSTHPETVVRRFGRAVLLRETEYAAFLACRLRERFGTGVEVARTEPLNEYRDVPEHVRAAAAAYEARESPSTSYAKFAAGTAYPDPEAMRETRLAD
ncbi:hypothetical protein MBEHAL_0769 [Halarchaeum acidiphilum MH1-52-1]|uniref:Uncharacterized protein n=1 Tax=Halarchaeum acidiphilum MH1-52-1 TaxID=1261545 RepID=U3A2Y1_9EURY|nr:hypothetical protein [Halarchaeum acidiphilum]GAD52009.1 hypothetical protein MBEHAL_0769 [Halarchaeum acidiphilum MH1-52-1]